MTNKLFADVLQENLNKDSFKPKTPPLDIFKKDIHEYFINLKELSKIHNSRTFYAKLFKYPIKISFYWCEEYICYL